MNDELQRVKDQLKTSMKNKYERLFEGLKLQENESLLNSIYTQLYIIEGESEGVNEEHEVLQMEKTARTNTHKTLQSTAMTSLKPQLNQHVRRKTRSRLFLLKASLESEKTVSVQKFILDWAEGKDNQDVDFMFVLHFES